MGCRIYSKNAVNLEIKIFPADCNNLMGFNSGLVDSKKSGLKLVRFKQRIDICRCVIAKFFSFRTFNFMVLTVSNF